MKQVWDRRAEFQVIESVQYYFNKIDVIKMPDYLPDKDDILFSRVRTSGIVTERYLIDGTVFEMYDVGGQVRIYMTTHSLSSPPISPTHTQPCVFFFFRRPAQRAEEMDPLFRRRNGRHFRRGDLRVRPKALRGRVHQPHGGGVGSVRGHLQQRIFRQIFAHPVPQQARLV